MFCPRIIQDLSLYIQNYTQINDKITILSPYYNPISQAILINQRNLLESQLVYHNNSYSIDFDDLEDKFRQSVCFILTSPHNPTGTVWTQQDLIKIANLAEQYRVFIISDDVHADFIFNNRQHQVISSFSNYVEQTHLFVLCLLKPSIWRG
ncbi:MAG: aminotransferase class I/II-fold pyridoxal phosphate-dependent enzyme [Arsenophonus endosymbiont of Dermacentor nuttalli]